MSNPSGNKKRFRFGLRTLVIFVTLIALTFGAYRAFVAPYLRQNEIRLAIKEAGGSYETKPAPAWLEFVFGEENVCVLTKVDLARIAELRGHKFGNRPISFTPETALADPPRSLLAQLNELTDLEALNVAGQDVDDNIVAAWKDLNRLRSLDLAFTLVRDPNSWPQFPLTALDLESVFISTENAAALSRYPELKSLNLADTPLTDVGLARLKPLTALQDLNLNDTSVTTVSIDALKAFADLDRLKVGRLDFAQFLMTNADTVDDGLVIAVDSAAIAAAREDLQERIDKFDAYSADKVLFVELFEGYHLDLLAGNENITELSFSLTFLRREDIQVLPTLPNLTSLTINDIGLDEEAWSVIATCPKLESVGTNSLNDAGLRRLLKCASIRDLGLYGSQITDQGLAYLAARPELEGIALYGTPMTDKSLHYLQALENLEWIMLPLIRGPGIRDLSELPKLQEVVFVPAKRWAHWRQLSHDAEPTLTAEDINDFAAVAESQANSASEEHKQWMLKYWNAIVEVVPFPGCAQAKLMLMLEPFELTDQAKKRLLDGGAAWEALRKQ